MVKSRPISWIGAPIAFKTSGIKDNDADGPAAAIDKAVEVMLKNLKS